MAMATTSNNGTEGLLYSLFLFACSAKLWTTLNNDERRRRPLSNDIDDDARPPTKSNGDRLPDVAPPDARGGTDTAPSDLHLENGDRSPPAYHRLENGNWSHFETREHAPLSFHASPQACIVESERGDGCVPPHQRALPPRADCLPTRLIMVRHGQSEGNVDQSAYATTPDNAMRLTELGWEMARMAGRELREQLPPGETVHFVVSPYVRTVETFHGMASAWSDPEELAHVADRGKRLKLWYARLMGMGLTWHEDPRIREQDFGNYQDPRVIEKAKAERHKFGSFYYRFPHGESASDVFDRVSTFLDSLWRSFESGRAQNYVLVAHGISIRVFLTRYFRYSIDQFHTLANPKNCETIVLKHDGRGRLELDGRSELVLGEVEAGDGSKTTVVTGYEKHSKLSTLPPRLVQNRSMRMFHGDD